MARSMDWQLLDSRERELECGWGGMGGANRGHWPRGNPYAPRLRNESASENVFVFARRGVYDFPYEHSFGKILEPSLGRFNWVF